MNLTRVLDVSLPPLPKLGRERYFRFNPNIVWRKQVEKGQTQILAIGPQTRKVFIFTPEKWALVRLFDGVRSYAKVQALWKRQHGVSASVDMIREFAEMLERNGFWLRTAEEEAMAVMEELKAREKQVKKRSAKDLTKIYIATVDADKQITAVQRWLWFVWSTPFVLASIVALGLMVGLWIARWDEVFKDSALYWSMTGKTWLDVLEFYAIFAVVGFCHESGHALTAKNFGAEVHRTGLLLVYTMPAFFVDTTEAIVHANYFQRMYVILAGFWFELMLCAVATFIWWGTAIGGTVHNLAYKVILVGGIMPVVFNMNPLMRLDGYLLFTKMLRLPYLRERSTAYLSGLVRSRIFRLPVKVEPLPRRRAIFFGAYAFLAGAYTYTVLLFLARVTYRVVHNYSPDWAFLPAGLVAFGIFRGRIEKFIEFLKSLYEEHKAWVMAHRTTVRAAAVALLIFLFLPLWRETARAPVILEPKDRAALAARVPGLVEDVLVNEGDTVRAGTTVATLRALDVESEKSEAASQLRAASANATAAQLRYADFAAAEAERRQWAERVRQASDKERRLSVTAPIDGVIVATRIRDLRGSYLTEGTPIAEVHDISEMRARIYVDEGDMRILNNLDRISLKLDSRVGSLKPRVENVSSAPEEPEAGLVDLTKYKGLKPPLHYMVSVLMANDGTLRTGMSGEAKLFGRRRSVMGLLWRPVADFAGRKIW